MISNVLFSKYSCDSPFQKNLDNREATKVPALTVPFQEIISLQPLQLSHDKVDSYAVNEENLYKQQRSHMNRSMVS